MRSLRLWGLLVLSCVQQVLVLVRTAQTEEICTDYTSKNFTLQSENDVVSTTSEEYKLLEHCGRENGLTIEDLRAAENLDEHEIGENIKCVLQCVLYQRNYADDGGRIQVDAILDEIVAEFGQERPDFRELLAQPLENCRFVEGATPCQVAYNTYKCLYS